jgi:AmmeMemoRadiSam system protein A
VTLTIKGALRGCIGHILPHEPLYQAVIDNARSAAINDTRFPALTLEELENVHIEVSVLTKPKALQFDGPKDLLAKLRPNIDGVVLHIGGRMATFLPQVWEQLPDKVEFLNHLSTKAGCAATAWQQPGTTIETYQAEAFHEPEPTVTQ